MAIQGGPITPMDPFGELLASLPDVTRRKPTGDGTEPGGTAGRKANPQQSMQDESQGGSLLAPGATLADASDAVRFKAIDGLMRSQDRLARNRWAIDTHYDRIRRGVAFSRLEKVPNVNQWVARLPNGMTKESSAATPNKADDLCNKVEDTLMSDPPKPIADRHVNDETIREAADLVGKILSQDGGEAGTDDNATYRWALNNAFSRAASILHYRVDPSGGGYQPLQILAHPQAQDVQNPLVAMVPGPPDAMGQPSQIPDECVNPILRYVSAPDQMHPAGQFVQDAAQADRVWLPAIVIDRLRREQVRTFPQTAPVDRAECVILTMWCEVGDGRKLWPDTVGKMDATQLSALANWRPVMSEQFIVPYAFLGLSGGGTGPGVDEVGSLSPLLRKRMYFYRTYVKASPEYRQGFWCDLNGNSGGLTLAEGNLEYTVTVPTEGKVTRCRDIPCVQIRPMQDVSGGDPLGWPFVSRFAGSSEAESTLYAAFADLCDNMLHPHVFIRSNVAIDDDDWEDRTVPTILGPQDSEPTYEQFATLPPVLELISRMDTAMDTASGLTATAQGLDSPNSVSGVSKQLSVRQALVSLSGFQQNLHAGMTRGWRIKCQLMQAEFTTPMLLQYAGEESSSAAEWWTGADFAGVDEIGIQPGTGTMMTPEGKAQYVAFLQSQQWLQADQAAEVALPGIRMDLGIPDNPADAWLDRCVDTWLKGASQEWLQAAQSQQQQLQQAQAAYQQQAAQLQQMGQVPPPFQAPPQQPLPSAFPALPNLSEIPVAMKVVKRLSDLMFDPRYAAQPPLWQNEVVKVYSQARQAQIPPPPNPQVRITGDAKDAQTLAAEESASRSGWTQPPQPTAPPSGPNGNSVARPSPVPQTIPRLPA